MCAHLPFSSLKTSTKTIMVYTNITFDLKCLFALLPSCSVRMPTGKKIKKSDIWGPYGGFISIQNGKETKGVDIRKIKKKCRAFSDGKNSKLIEHFLNQISVLMSLTSPDKNEGNYNVHMMWFNTSIKIAGCR